MWAENHRYAYHGLALCLPRELDAVLHWFYITEDRVFDFTDKVALVTGSSRGIGRVIACELVGAGAKVAVHYVRNRQATEDKLGLLGGEPHIIVQAEMGDLEAVREMVNAVVSHFGCLDILINNAGVHEAHPIAEVSYKE